MATSGLAEPTPGEPVSTYIDARPAALFEGEGIAWGELRPILNEAAGAEALQELILDRRLAEAAEDAGILIDDDDVGREQKLLLESLSPDGNTAVRLLDELRRRQRLGPYRYRTLVRRNAVLRALVRDQVEVTDAQVEQAFDAAHGPKRQVRLLTTPDLASVQVAAMRIGGGEFFGEVAVELSTDASASRGGLLQPVSARDPSYPSVLRQAIWTLDEPGDVSDPVLLDNCYALIQLVEETPADGVTLADARADLEKLVRLNQERIRMDQLARRLLTDVNVTIFDDSLHDAWRRRTRMRE